MTDHLDTLGLAPGASLRECRQAYLRQAQHCHPDRNAHPRAAAQFQQLQQAYQTAQQQAAEVNSAGAPQCTTAQRYTLKDSVIRHDPLSRTALPVFQGSLQLTLEEVVEGIDRPVILTLISPAGRPQISTLHLCLPPGLSEGQSLLLSGGSTQAHLLLKVVYQQHAVFHAEGRDLHLKLPVSPQLARDGGQRTLPTLWGPRTLTLPAGCHSGQRLSMTGLGLPARTATDKQCGQLYLSLYIETASSQQRRAQSLYQQVASPHASREQRAIA